MKAYDIFNTLGIVEEGGHFVIPAARNHLDLLLTMVRTGSFDLQR